MESSHIWVPLIRQDSSDCLNSNVNANDPDRIGGIVVVARAADGSFRVDVTINKGTPDTTYHFYLKCVQQIGDIRTDRDGVGTGSFVFAVNLVGAAFAFDSYPEGAPSGNKFQSVKVTTQNGNFISSAQDPVLFLKLTFPRMYNALLAQGWKVSAGDRSALKDVQATVGGTPVAAVHCVDGRKYADPTYPMLMRGPKVQGGVLGIAALAGDIKSGSKEGIQNAVKKIQAAGYIASVHGDEHNEHLGHPAADGCGFANKWYAGALTTLKLTKLELSPDDAKAEVEKSGGKFIKLPGEHEEEIVRLNFVEGKTFEPDGTAFNLDVWFAAKMGIDPETLMRNAADTVLTLKGLLPIQVVF